MGAIDDILGGGSGYAGIRKPLRTAAPAIDPSMQGAPNTVGSQPGTQAQKGATTAQKGDPAAQTQKGAGTIQARVPGVDDTKLAGKPGSIPSGAKVDGPRNLSYTELFEMFNPDKPETPEQRAKREKREKGEAVLAAVGDGISALSNLWFTSQYAPNAYDPSKGMSATTKDRWDKLRQEREAKRREYYEGYVRARSMDDAKERDDRDWRHKLEREKIADDRYEVKEARDRKLAELDEQLKRHQITAAEYKAEQERIKAEFATQSELLDLGYKQAGIQQRKAAAAVASHASANASNERAEYYRSGAGSAKGGTLQLEDDEPMRIGKDKDYDRTVMRLAPVYGVPTKVEEVTEWGSQYNPQTKAMERVPKKTRKVARPVKDIAADIEREAEKRKNGKGNTMPGVGGSGGSSTTMPGVK